MMVYYMFKKQFFVRVMIFFISDDKTIEVQAN